MTAPQDERSDVTRLGTILSIWAHPDDETFVCGGVMAAAVANGQKVVCVSATAGERGTGDPDAWPPERLGQVRRWEAAAAMAILGVTDHRWLDLPDGGLADLDPTEPVSRLADIVREVRPDTTLTFGPDGGTFHPDHQTISAWAGEAWRQAGSPGRLFHAVISNEHLETWGDLYDKWNVFMTDERPKGAPDDEIAIRLALRDEALDQKIAALCAMYTQVAPSIAAIGHDLFRETNSVETFVDASES